MTDTELQQKALNLSYFFLKFRPRTEQEMVNYLIKKSVRYHFTDTVIHETIQFLKQDGYLDDGKFIDLYVKNRTLLKPRSTFLLKNELIKLGVSKDLVDAYLNDNKIDDQELANEALRKKFTSLNRLNEEIRYKKAVSYLLRKGFSYDIAKNAYRNLFDNN